MSTFVFHALDRQGNSVSGTLDADSRKSAIDDVSRRGLTPVTIEESATGIAAAARPVGRLRRVSSASVDAFIRGLANLLAAGVPLSRALQISCREATQPASREQRAAIRDAVVGGQPLAEAMAAFPKAFPPVVIAMVRAGEAGGFLDTVLVQIADFRQRDTDLRSRVRGALVYPALLALMTVAVLVLCLTLFIPRFSGFFAEYGAQLPLLTRAIVAASDALLSPWSLAVVVAAALLAMLARRSLMTESGRRWRDHASLKLPVMGPMIARFALVRFFRMLGTLLQSGVPLVSALRVAREAIGNQTLTDAVNGAIEQVQRGQSLASSLALCPALFPPSVIEMSAVAEESGRLDQELVRIAASFETELDRTLRVFVSLAEPALLFIMAGVVGTIVVGMLLPILSLQELIH